MKYHNYFTEEKAPSLPQLEIFSFKAKRSKIMQWDSLLSTGTEWAFNSCNLYFMNSKILKTK